MLYPCWLNHHHILGLAWHADDALVRLNALFLLDQAFIPFPTALMGEYATNPLAVSAFGAVMAVNTLLSIARHASILRHLLKPELVDALAPHIIRKSLAGVFSHAVGAAAAWVSVHAAFVTYLLAPPWFLVPPTRRGVASSSAAGGVR